MVVMDAYRYRQIARHQSNMCEGMNFELGLLSRSSVSETAMVKAQISDLISKSGLMSVGIVNRASNITFRSLADTGAYRVPLSRGCYKIQ
jgi:hypothetical protein